ncbi:amino acid adenylation domain-containing protein [Nocardia caishijiensis]|uniref:Non-ribosomal peptide synthase protein (TIGR01720 family)/amino acid adenylation domain-containing protein n=1 Tax=Nocardia caishijiensis TaxID=184756 RepID=A0ABQ6YSM6_9NOCA|nr:non-ribosomal peptide synthetase [Nocardia caishijiensis]KAF0848509.1 non-ribosomal peptide synthase protein (TIGR01720 family)/amino acid adenylation domain-containing protein [Nocardia caishijiensis]
MGSVERDDVSAEHPGLPLTGAQSGIWNAQRLDPESLSYLVGEVLEISGTEPIDLPVLDTAIRRTIAETDTMRLRFSETATGPRQRITDSAPELRPLVDLRGEADPVAAAHRLVAAERERAATVCREMVDRQLYTYTLLRLTDNDVWCVQLYHHLIIDGYSAAMVSRRVAAHYTALRRGTEPPRLRWGSIETLVAEDLEYRESQAHRHDREYWRDRLTPLPPLDGRGRAPEGVVEQTHEVRAVLDADLMARVKTAATAAGITWADVLVAGYAGFVHRLLGETDVVIALPVMARVGKTALTTPSMAVNVLPLRVSVFGQDRLGELGKRVADALREMRAHQRFRGEDLAREFGGAKTGALLHGIGVNLKAFDFALDFDGATGTLRNVAGGPPEDLGLTVTPLSQDRIQLGFEVDARSLDAATARRRMDALVTLITELVDADKPIGAITLYPAEVAARGAGAHAGADLPGRPDDVVEVFDRMVAARPDDLVLVHGDRRLTAEDLGARVHQLARYLRGRGVGPEDIVGIALPRSVDLVIALLAVRHAGAAFLMLDTSHPAQRLADIIDDATPALILTDEVVADHLASAVSGDTAPADLLQLSDSAIRAAITELPSDPLAAAELAAPRSAGHLAYVVYTSGSTGKPKGVQISCGAMAQLLHHHRATVYADTAARVGGRQLHVAHTYSFAFDAALDQLLWLWCGHRIHLYGSDVQKDAAAQIAALQADRIDVVDTTPSMATALIDNGLLGSAHRPELLLLGGEATPPALWSTIVASKVVARNMYGPTEATVDALSAPVTGAVPHVGDPLAGTRAYLLDGALQPVPDGEIGELYLAGPQLARGYLGRMVVTAERFVADPFAAGERMYRTGDRARRLPGHGYDYLGRADSQIKVRGYRVELGEVEACLGALPGVAAAAATIRKSGDSTRLVGYLVPETGRTLDADQLRHRLTALVPDHLVPSALVILDALPTTVNGKLDRAALPAPQLTSTGRPARTERERALCGVVAEVLGLTRVDATDDFFGLGGDSITAIGVSSRLRAIGWDVQPKTLLAQRDLATIAATAQTAAARTDTPTQDEPTGPVPATPMVAALLAANTGSSTIAGYTQWTALTLHEGLTLDDLTSGLQTLLDRHDALRLVLDRSGAGLEVAAVGTVRAAALVSEIVADANQRPEPALDSVATALAGELAPTEGVQIRAALVRTGPGGADRLVLVANHLVVDGVSWRILVPELHEACSAARDSRPARLPAKGSSWRRYATLLAESGGAGEFRSELAHWERALGDASVATLGERGLDPAVDLVESAEQTRTFVTPAVTDAFLTTLPTAYRAKTDEVLLAALMLALNAWRHERGEVLESGRPVAVEGHGREALRPDTDFAGTVGWFTSEFPVWTPATGIDDPAGLTEALSGGAAAGRLLRAVKEAKRAVPGNGVGYGVLCRLDPETSPRFADRRAPEVLLNYLGRFGGGGAPGWSLPAHDAFAVTEPPEKTLTEVLSLNVFVHESAQAGGPRLAVEWTAASRILDADQVVEIQRHFELALAAFAAHARLYPGGLTPSDSPGVTVGQETIDALERTHGPLAHLLPLSPLQEGLLFHAIRDGADDVYTLSARVDLHGPLDGHRLSAAFDTVVGRHPTMAAAFHYEGLDQPVQAVPRAVGMPWREVDLADLPSHTAYAAADRIEAEAIRHRFAVDRSPMLRATLVRLPDDAHRLVLNTHHLVIDGWSTPIVLREVLATYHGDDLPPAPAYSDYLTWLDTRDHQAVRAAWSQRLTGLEKPTLIRDEMPSRAADRAGEGAEQPADATLARDVRQWHVPLPTALATELAELGRRRALTMNTLVQGTWALVLAALTGRTDVVFGATVSGRPAELPGVAGMVGLFANTVPVRCRIAPARPLLDQWADLQENQFAMQEFDYASLAEIERVAGLGTLFDTLVAFENFPNSGSGQPDSHDLRLGDFHNHGNTHYPLTLIAPPGDQLTLVIWYDRAAVPETVLRNIADRITAILTAVAATPQTAPSQFLEPFPGRPIDAAAATPDAISAPQPAGATAAAPAKETSAGPIVESAARPRPTGTTLAEWGVPVDPAAPAITAEGATIDFGEFDARANRLARWLISRGVGPETVVAVAMPRTVDSVVAAHAICRAGGVYLPVDPEQPAQRIQQILDTASPAMILRSLDEAGLPSADDREQHGFADTPLTDADRLAPLRSTNTACLLFTSGSTGTPKGVSLSHAAIISTFDWLQREVGFGPGDTMLYRTPPIFDASLMEMFLPLHVGARIVLTRPGGHRDPYYQAQLMSAERVTAMWMTTSMLTVLAEEADLSGCADLRCVLTGGEVLPPATAQRMRALTGTAVYNFYGPTEAAIGFTFHKTVDADTTSVPVGAPADAIRILDDHLRPVPEGTVGELYMTGSRLARGYLARPDLTVAAFVADPFGSGERVYRTGDLVKLNADGELEYIGRTDSQVKLRGQRIELGDIEAALLACPGVAHAVVQLREDAPGDQRLVAYLVAKSAITPDTDTVREQLRNTLPAYMIPAAIVVLEHIPRTATEKIDRRALPAPESHTPDGRIHTPTATTATPDVATGHLGVADDHATVAQDVDGPLDTIRAAMAAVLSVAEIGADDDFFDKGGHSLLAVRLVGRLTRANLPVVLDDVFSAPTPRALAARIGTADPATPTKDGLAGLGRRLDPVLELRAEGSVAPLFCIHQIGGTAWKYAPLARLLRAERPVIGLQMPHLTEPTTRTRTLDDLARYYLAAVRRIQPHGPYHFLGYSLGGNLAHAMAAILEAEGEQVAYVGLLDSHPLSNLTERAAATLADPSGMATLVPEITEYPIELASVVTQAATELLRMVTESESPSYSGPMALYCADNGLEPERVHAQLTGWQAAGARLVVRRLPYTHNEIAMPTGWIEVAALIDADPAIRT